MKKDISLRLEEIAVLVKGQLVGNGQAVIHTASDIENAGPNTIVFAESAKLLSEAMVSSAGAILTTSDLAQLPDAADKPLVLVGSPRHAFLDVLDAFSANWPLPTGIHAGAIVAEGVQLGNEIRIGPQVHVEAGVTLGDRVTLMAGVKIGAGCTIGSDTIVYPNAVLYPNVKVGRGCLLHAGCVLGADGFGYEPTKQGARKVAHIGVVELGDGVEVGANTCIDRAKTGKTVIGSGTKIDNLVHIAHNVQIGMATLIVAQTGVAGSARIGSGVILAGQSGIKDHINIGDGAKVGAQGGVIGDVARGEQVSGYPAREHRGKMREYAALANLPAALKHIRTLEKRLTALESRLVLSEKEVLD